jgi:hypothetical protein
MCRRDAITAAAALTRRGSRPVASLGTAQSATLVGRISLLERRWDRNTRVAKAGCGLVTGRQRVLALATDVVAVALRSGPPGSIIF